MRKVDGGYMVQFWKGNGPVSHEEFVSFDWLMETFMKTVLVEHNGSKITMIAMIRDGFTVPYPNSDPTKISPLPLKPTLVSAKKVADDFYNYLTLFGLHKGF